MPVRVRCRCGQEFVLRYREWIYFLLGLLVLCLMVNTMVLLLLYFRLEEKAAARKVEAVAPEAVAHEAAAHEAVAPGLAGVRTEVLVAPGGEPEPTGGESEIKNVAPPSKPPEQKEAAGEPSPTPRRGDRHPAERHAAQWEPAAASPRGGAGGPLSAAPPAALGGRGIAIAPPRSFDSEESLFKELSSLSLPEEGADAPRAGSRREETRREAPQPGQDQGPKGLRELVEGDALLRLLLLERVASDFPVVCAFLLDPDLRLRRRALEITLTAALPAASEAAAKVKQESLEPLLLLAAPVLRDDGLEKELAFLCRNRFPTSARLVDGRIFDPRPPWSDAGAGGVWNAAREAALEKLREESAVALRDWLVKAKAGGVEVALLVDVTQSMEDALRALSREAEWLLPALEWGVPRLEVALVLFRDEVVAVEDLSPAPVAKLLPILRQLKGEGGGDVPEGVHVAVKTALSLGNVHWRKEAEKHLFIIGDAPPPFARHRQLGSLVRQASLQEGYRLHALSVNPEAGRAAVPFFPELAAAGGGRAATAKPEEIGGEILRCLLAPAGDAAAQSLASAMRALFRPEN